MVKWRPPITTEFRGCATGVTGKIVAASATMALNDIYLAFQIFQSYICDAINLFIQKETDRMIFCINLCHIFDNIS
jgi:hypothetical protein